MISKALPLPRLAPVTQTSVSLNGFFDLETLVISGEGDTIVTAAILGDPDLTVTGGDGGDAIFTGDGDDTISGGAGNDIIDGGNGDNTLLGGAGNDTITGGDDDDIISGGTGFDSLTGGAGEDTFIVETGTATAAAVETISDFVTTVDMISFGGPAGTEDNFEDDAGIALSFTDAKVLAESFLDGTVVYVEIDNGGAFVDNLVFYDDGADGTADSAVSTMNLGAGADVVFGDIIGPVEIA